LAESKLKDESAFKMFRALVGAQGGDVSYIDDPEKLPKASLIEDVPAPKSGYLKGINAQIIGETSVELGAGRAKKGDPIDHAVGIVVHHKVGERVKKGEALFTLHANDEAKLAAARARVLAAHTWSAKKVKPLKHSYGLVK
jgi:pyrimidine-nucleoside phosphorylase